MNKNLRTWLRRHSTIWQHFDPAPLPPRYRCGCTQQVLVKCPDHDHHQIGWARANGKIAALYCDGGEKVVERTQ